MLSFTDCAVAAAAMHLQIADGGRDGPATHGVDLDVAQSVGRRDRERHRDLIWGEAVVRVLERRRNGLGRGLQRWTCTVETWLRRRARVVSPSTGIR